MSEKEDTVSETEVLAITLHANFLPGYLAHTFFHYGFFGQKNFVKCIVNITAVLDVREMPVPVMFLAFRSRLLLLRFLLVGH